MGGGVKVAGCCLQWQWKRQRQQQQQQPATPFSSKIKRFNGGDRIRTCHITSQFLGTISISTTTKLSRRRSMDDFFNPKGRGGNRCKDQLVLKRAISASLHSFTNDDDDEEFIRRLQELNLKLHSADTLTQEEEILPDSRNRDKEAESLSSSSSSSSNSSSFSNAFSSAQPPWPPVQPEPPPNWLDQDHIVPASVEIKANSVDLPLSLRILQQKKKKNNNNYNNNNKLQEAGESACCSVKKAFSSMVFIVRELQSYSLQMREILCYTNLNEILARVQDEMNASFVWLFQQIFSSTPTLMLYLMLLLANFTVYSISPNSIAIAAVSAVEIQQDCQQQRFDDSSIKSFSVGRTTTVGGGSGGGGKVKPVAGATDDGQPGSSSYSGSSIVPDQESGEDIVVWKRVMEEASRMQASLRDEVLMDPDTSRMLVSPISVEMEGDGEYWEYKQRELMYHQAMSQDPENVLILSNFAQFLFIVLHDHDRAEYYFKRAIGISKSADAEALSRYANFLWLARKDLGAAEETYLEAIAADPSNAYYAANYAHFLWNTGGEDTCYPPLDDSNDTC